MRRRRFLAVAGSGLAIASAGCRGNGGADTARTPTGERATPADPAATSSPATSAGDELPVDGSELVRAARRDRIPAIVDPVFGTDWSAVPESLGDGDRVVGVERDGAARAYPLAVLSWHEVVNDVVAEPLLVTYCPLCGSGVTARRRVDGRATRFGVSGYLYRRALVLYDESTDSLWSQILGQAIRGPRTGDRLDLVPSTLTTWGEWRGAHPDTSVLVPPPKSGTVGPNGERNYNVNPYSEYQDSQPPDYSRGRASHRLPPKATVLGIAVDGAARAYPLGTVLESGGVVTDRVGDRPVVVASTEGSLVAYVRRVDGETLVFRRDGDWLVAGESRWNPVSGTAVDGPHEGTTLQRANARSPMFWFAWRDFFPGTDVYGQK